jgi:hypothetical protein
VPIPHGGAAAGEVRRVAVRVDHGLSFEEAAAYKAEAEAQLAAAATGRARAGGFFLGPGAPIPLGGGRVFPRIRLTTDVVAAPGALRVQTPAGLGGGRLRVAAADQASDGWARFEDAARAEEVWTAWFEHCGLPHGCAAHGAACPAPGACARAPRRHVDELLLCGAVLPVFATLGALRRISPHVPVRYRTTRTGELVAYRPPLRVARALDSAAGGRPVVGVRAAGRAEMDWFCANLTGEAHNLAAGGAFFGDDWNDDDFGGGGGGDDF